MSRRFLVLVMLLAMGCKTMTSVKEADLLESVEKRLQAERAQQASRQAEEARLRKEIETAELRREKRAIVAQHLQTGSAADALAIVDELLPPARGAGDEKTGAAGQPRAEAPAILDPEEHAALLALRGAALGELGRDDEAIAAFRSSLELDGTSATAQRGLAKVLLKQKKHRAALEAIGPLLAAGTQDADCLETAARASFELWRAERSLATLEAARVALEPLLLRRQGNVELTKMLATVCFETGRYREAMAHYESLRADNPLDPELLEQLSSCHLAAGDRSRALDLLELGGSLRPPSPGTARTLHDLARSQGHPLRAADWLARAHRQNPGEAPPADRLEIGDGYADGGRWDEAIRWLTAVDEGDPGHARAQAKLVLAYVHTEKPDEAVAAYEQARKAGVQDPAVHLAAGRAYLARKLFPESVDAFARASGLPGRRAEAYAGLAEVAYATGNLEAAAHYYRRALEASPGDARYLSSLRQVSEALDLAAQVATGAAPPNGESSP